MKLTSTSACTAVVLLLGALPVSAQQMDMAVYNKWSTVTVVHYVVVGEFSAVASVASPLDRSTVSAKARVKDRVEVTFDWDGSEMKATSAPVIKNFPTTIDSVTPYGGCGAPRLSGAYEHMTLLSAAADGLGNMKTSLKRDFAGAVILTLGDASVCGPSSVTLPPKSETEASMLLVAPPMMLAMPSTATTKVSADKKSVSISDAGWTWTYTMTAVR